jgi:hypothetical protein
VRANCKNETNLEEIVHGQEEMWEEHHYVGREQTTQEPQCLNAYDSLHTHYLDLQLAFQLPLPLGFLAHCSIVLFLLFFQHCPPCVKILCVSQ